MANGQQIAEENVHKFAAWAASKTDSDFRTMAIRGVLSRADIATECGFAKSVLSQNPRIRESLCDLEDQLRSRGILPKAASESNDTVQQTTLQPVSAAGSFRHAERLKRLEQENASLRAELEQVKRLLARYTVLQVVSGANRHDSMLFEQCLDTIPALRGLSGRPRARGPGNCMLTRGMTPAVAGPI